MASGRWSLGGLLVAAAFLLAGAATGQEQADVGAANRQALGDAMGRVLIRKVVSGNINPSTIVGGTLDLNLDGFGEEFVSLYKDPCDDDKCGLYMFALIGDEYRESIGAVTGSRTSSPNQLTNGKRNGYFDIQFGPVLAAWDGNRYVDAASLPQSTLNTAQFMAACTQRTDTDYALQQAGVDPAAGRATICTCEAKRFAEFNLSQADMDRYQGYIAANGIGDQFNDEAFLSLQRQVQDIETGCLADNGWTTWSAPMGANDAQQPQLPLLFDNFIESCSVQDWLISNPKVGTGDRALGLCGCLGRRLAAQGFSQDMLDALTKYYTGEFGETEVDEAGAQIMQTSDTETDACVGSLPLRAAAP